MSELMTLWENAIKETEEARKIMEFGWVNDNNGSYSIAKDEYKSAVIRANELFDKIKQENDDA